MSVMNNPKKLMYNEKLLLFAMIFVLTASIALRACRRQPHILRFKKEFIDELKNRFCFVHEIIENHFVTLVDKADTTIHIIDRIDPRIFPKLNSYDFRQIFDKILFKSLQCKFIFKKIYPDQIRYIISWDYVVYDIRILLSASESDSLRIKINELHAIPIIHDGDEELEPSPAS